MKISVAAIGIILTVGGCQIFDAAKMATTPVGQPTLTQLRNDTLAAKTGYEALLVLAVNYNAIARCGKVTSPVICSDPAIIAQIRKNDTLASAALDAAESSVRAVSPDMTVASATVLTATNAIAAFKAVVPSQGK